ncbi:hypothetical protein PT285_01710 [Lactobacillus sp. ESL0791]|uniref:hypothetical protein n=1 Tax=Lactobacillus sp. ESL0791 TaxID=2983234 RepID=UPI0023F75F8A|nr:hypothetical protein [Lactobacillus sp. ESL0791]MDF7638153.1 hypothetical protein [Lactobacillus sp. ESL0791]
MKLIKIKILTVISGLLTLSGLVMLFFGLCNQLDRSNHFLMNEQVINLNGYTDSTIFLAVTSIVIFGVMFFTNWAKSRQLQAHLIRHKS